MALPGLNPVIPPTSVLLRRSYDVIDGRVVVRAIVNVAPGAELFVSYLSLDESMRPTEDRRLLLLEDK